ncbi:uncharacterized protein LOC123503088 [Portunus trituberculatus]|uniref:uncharacterized protein LOC123503088 n=1 Tax=Portunus trituberculatus TaxID=210409 RepID=UPI001E1CCEAB|nr:uncharacterized protein LOC123503088 [Portunus trituberculatus]
MVSRSSACVTASVTTAVTERMSLCSCVALTSAGRRMSGVSPCALTLESHTTASAGQDTDSSGSSTVKTLTSAWSRPDHLHVGFLKMRRRGIIHTSFPTHPAYHKTTGTEVDRSARLHAPMNRTVLYSSHRSMTTAKQAQNKVLSDHDDSVLLTPKK